MHLTAELWNYCPLIQKLKTYLVQSINRPEGDLYFDIDEFKFPGDERPALHNVHFMLKRGETMGIVGKTGSGKTAILKLLLREFEGYKGSVVYGGNPINQYKQQRLRESIGYVPQDHFLFSTTLLKILHLQILKLRRRKSMRQLGLRISTKIF